MDLNGASAEELERTFEVDGERARYIIEKRNQIGGFDSWEQVNEIVPSIDEKMVENLRAAGLSLGSRSDRDGHRQGRHNNDQQPCTGKSVLRRSAQQGSEYRNRGTA